jgi:hypothetical protein
LGSLTKEEAKLLADLVDFGTLVLLLLPEADLEFVADFDAPLERVDDFEADFVEIEADLDLVDLAKEDDFDAEALLLLVALDADDLAVDFLAELEASLDDWAFEDDGLTDDAALDDDGLIDAEALDDDFLTEDEALDADGLTDGAALDDDGLTDAEALDVDFLTEEEDLDADFDLEEVLALDLDAPLITDWVFADLDDVALALLTAGVDALDALLLLTAAALAPDTACEASKTKASIVATVDRTSIVVVCWVINQSRWSKDTHW